MEELPSTARKWPFPKSLDSRLWRFSSACIIGGTAIFCKIWLEFSETHLDDNKFPEIETISGHSVVVYTPDNSISFTPGLVRSTNGSSVTVEKTSIGWLNRKHVYNLHILEEAFKRGKDTPLVTVTNHISCFDEPLLWGMLKWRHVMNAQLIRWSIGADEMCFYTWLLSQYFSKGKVIPVIRGNGVYQKGMNFAIERLDKGDWVHIFPEGKVNETGKIFRLKWGVGQLVIESTKSPIVIPFWQLGLDDVLPNRRPYIPRIGKNVTINIGKPVIFSDIINEYKELKETAMGARKRVTDRIQERFKELKLETEKLHKIHKR